MHDVMNPMFTPTMLTTFERCPHQYHHKHVEKIRVPESFSPELACGNAAHSVLRGVLETYQRTGGYPINLRERIEKVLPPAPYIDNSIWEADVSRVLAWLKGGLSSIDETARVIFIERWLEYPFPGNHECPPFRLRHCVDLGLEHDDGTIEHRDWKTGKSTDVDALQNAAARIVLRHAFPDHPTVLSSTVFLTHGIVQIDDLTREQVSAEWQRMKSLAARIMAEQDWFPSSNALCPWCPFYQRNCSLYSASNDRPDSTTEWLEGAA